MSLPQFEALFENPIAFLQTLLDNRGSVTLEDIHASIDTVHFRMLEHVALCHHREVEEIAARGAIEQAIRRVQQAARQKQAPPSPVEKRAHSPGLAQRRTQRRALKARKNVSLRHPPKPLWKQAEEAAARRKAGIESSDESDETDKFDRGSSRPTSSTKTTPGNVRKGSTSDVACPLEASSNASPTQSPAKKQCLSSGGAISSRK